MQGEYTFVDVRDSAVLTTSYVNSTAVDYLTVSPQDYNQLNLLVKATLGSLSSIQLKVEFSNDGSTWYQETFENISGGGATLTVGEYTISGDGNYIISIPIKFARIRVSAKGTGTVTNSLLEIKAALGNV